MQTYWRKCVLLCSRIDEKTTMRKQVPDTITSWVISGFSVDPLFGLGLSETPRKVWDKTEVFSLFIPAVLINKTEVFHLAFEKCVPTFTCYHVHFLPTASRVPSILLVFGLAVFSYSWWDCCYSHCGIQLHEQGFGGGCHTGEWTTGEFWICWSLEWSQCTAQ